MATAELVVAFGAKIEGLEASLKRVTTQLGDLQDKASNTQRSMQESVSGMSRAWESAAASIRTFALAFVGMKGFEVIKQGVLAVDDLNASIRRLQAVTGSTPLAAEDQFRRLADIAARTGQPVADLTDQFTRFYTATASLGTSSATVDRLVETLGNFARLSGKGTQEASAAITQLSQGLASGKLQGDELKSIMENMPLLATNLAKELGVSVGELRKMGEEGRLVANDVIPAILRAGENIKKQLEGVPLTIRQSFQVTSDRFVALIREIDKQVGASTGIADLLKAMGITAESIRARVAGAGTGASAADQITNLSREAAAANVELDKMKAALAALQSGQRPSITSGPNQNPYLGLTEPELRRAMQSREALLADHNNRIRAAQERQDQEAASDAAKRAREGAEAQAGNLSTLRRQLADEVDPKLAIERKYQEQLAQIARGEAQARLLGERERTQAEKDAAEARILAARRRQEELDKIAKKEAGPQRRTAATTDEDREAKAAADRIRAGVQAANQIVQAANDPVRNLNLQFQQFADASGQAGSAYGNFAARVANDNEDMSLGFRAIIEKSKAAGQALIAMGQDPQPAVEAMRAEFERFALILERANIPVEAIRDALARAGQEGSEAFSKLADKADNSLNEVKKNIVNTFARDVSSTLVDFATGAETSFGKVAADFAKMVAKMILNWMILQGVTYGLKQIGIDLSAPGGRSFNPDATGAPPGPARAAGSYGELSPYFTGSSPVIPSVSPSDTGVTVNVYNQSSGTQVRQQERSNGLGGKEIDIYIEEVVRRGLANGTFDNTMSSIYGTSRIGRV